MTRQTLLLPEHLTGLRAGCALRTPRPVALPRGCDAALFRITEKRDAALFLERDPLAIAAAIDPTLIDTAPVAVDVETAGTLTHGMTAADWRGVWRRKPAAQRREQVRSMDDRDFVAGERLARRRNRRYFTRTWRSRASHAVRRRVFIDCGRRAPAWRREIIVGRIACGASKISSC